MVHVFIVLLLKIIMEDFLKILSVFLLSSVKFGLGGIPLAIAGYGFNFIKTVIVTSSGGISGVYFFLILSEKLLNTWYKLFPKNLNQGRKKFTIKNKVIVLVKNKFGLLGLSIITPLILSIPLGVFLALRYYKNKKLILVYMAFSVLGTALILSSLRVFF